MHIPFGQSPRRRQLAALSQQIDELRDQVASLEQAMEKLSPGAESPQGGPGIEWLRYTMVGDELAAKRAELDELIQRARALGADIAEYPTGVFPAVTEGPKEPEGAHGGTVGSATAWSPPAYGDETAEMELQEKTAELEAPARAIEQQATFELVRPEPTEEDDTVDLQPMPEAGPKAVDHKPSERPPSAGTMQDPATGAPPRGPSLLAPRAEAAELPPAPRLGPVRATRMPAATPPVTSTSGGFVGSEPTRQVGAEVGAGRQSDSRARAGRRGRMLLLGGGFVLGVGAIVIAVVLVGHETPEAAVLGPTVSPLTSISSPAAPTGTSFPTAPATVGIASLPPAEVVAAELPADAEARGQLEVEAEAEVETELKPEAPVEATARVQSGRLFAPGFGGVNLRRSPSASAPTIRVVPVGTPVELLAGRVTADGLAWQQVRTPTGEVGWVVAGTIVR